MDAGKVWFSLDGVYQSALGESPNPVTGVDPAVSGLSGTFYPGVGLYYPTTAFLGTGTLQARTSNITNLPSGYSPWDPA